MTVPAEKALVLQQTLSDGMLAVVAQGHKQDGAKIPMTLVRGQSA